MRWIFLTLVCIPAWSARAATFHETFAANPLTNGWAIYGVTNLFAWNPTKQNLAVTWDSSQPNSYFYRPLGTTLSENDDFAFSFDVQFSSIAIGTDTNKPETFEVALGLICFQCATNPALERGVGEAANGACNVAEFDYFPDSGYGATISPTIISSNNMFDSSFSFPLTMDTGALFHILMSYTASNQTLVTTMTRNGQSFGPIKNTPPFGSSFTDFRLDAFAVSSYSDAGADGSLQAQATVANITIVTPPPPVDYLSGLIVDGTLLIEFMSNTNWVYTLRRSTDLSAWNDVSEPTPGNGAALFLQDTNSISGEAFYRVKAERP